MLLMCPRAAHPPQTSDRHRLHPTFTTGLELGRLESRHQADRRCVIRPDGLAGQPFSAGTASMRDTPPHGTVQTLGSAPFIGRHAQYSRSDPVASTRRSKTPITSQVRLSGSCCTEKDELSRNARDARAQREWRVRDYASCWKPNPKKDGESEAALRSVMSSSL